MTSPTLINLAPHQSHPNHQQRLLLLQLLEHGIQSVTAPHLCREVLQISQRGSQCSFGVKGQSPFSIDTSKQKIILLAAGKAACPMVEEVCKQLDTSLFTHICVSSHLPEWSWLATVLQSQPNLRAKISYHYASHPEPNSASVSAATEMLNIKANHNLNENDHIFMLLSGGASALLCKPVVGLSLSEKQLCNKLLLSSGLGIESINVIRKHLSAIKGGRLAQALHPCQIHTYALSDVPGDEPASIGSGPCVPDPSTYQDAQQILIESMLWDKFPETAKNHFEAGIQGLHSDTPHILPHSDFHLLGNVESATKAIQNQAAQQKLHIARSNKRFSGEPLAASQHFYGEILEAYSQGWHGLVAGGECHPKLPVRPGKGGRNQALTLHLIQQMQNFPVKWTLACCGSDGQDYLPGIAGGIGDGEGEGRRDSNSAKLQLDQEDLASLQVAIQNFDSYNWLEPRNGLIQSKATGSNVGDLVLILWN